MSRPAELGRWRGLDQAGRKAWIENAKRRFFKQRRKQPAREVLTIDGDDFDDRYGFYCAMGEAAGGPGGYFGWSLVSFDDCLFGGFGVESPCTIVWRNSARSRRVLDGRQLAFEYEQSREIFFAGGRDDEEDADRCAALRDAAWRGEETFFEAVLDSIRSVPERRRARPDLILRLVLE